MLCTVNSGSWSFLTLLHYRSGCVQDRGKSLLRWHGGNKRSGPQERSYSSGTDAKQLY